MYTKSIISYFNLSFKLNSALDLNSLYSKEEKRFSTENKHAYDD